MGNETSTGCLDEWKINVEKYKAILSRNHVHQHHSLSQMKVWEWPSENLDMKSIPEVGDPSKTVHLLPPSRLVSDSYVDFDFYFPDGINTSYSVFVFLSSAFKLLICISIFCILDLKKHLKKSLNGHFLLQIKSEWWRNHQVTAVIMWFKSSISIEEQRWAQKLHSDNKCLRKSLKCFTKKD